MLRDRSSAVIVAALVMATAVTSAASAMRVPHLKLKRSFPAKDTVLTSSPDAVRLWLTERAELPATKIVVTTDAKATVAVEKATRAAGADAPIEAKFAKPLTAGRYTVTWKTMSKDGHVVNGTFGFTVQPAPRVDALAWGPLAAKMLLYVGALIAIGRGSVAFLDPEWKAGARSVFDTPVPRAVARFGALALIAAPLLLLQLQIGALEMTRADIPTLLADTAWGQGWSQLTFACLLASATLVLPTGRTTSLVLVMASLGVAAAAGGLGHAAADEQWPLGARLLDAMHVAAMGAWIGGLLTTLLITRVPAFALRDAAWRTFSRTATIMAPVTVLTGVGSGARLLLGAPPAAVFASGYGFLLLIKTVLVLGVLAIGARQRSRIARGVAPGNRIMWVEIGVATCVLWVTAVLTGTEPPGE